MSLSKLNRRHEAVIAGGASHRPARALPARDGRDRGRATGADDHTLQFVCLSAFNREEIAMYLMLFSITLVLFSIPNFVCPLILDLFLCPGIAFESDFQVQRRPGQEQGGGVCQFANFGEISAASVRRSAECVFGVLSRHVHLLCHREGYDCVWSLLREVWLFVFPFFYFFFIIFL
jgi:hypothetical protein